MEINKELNEKNYFRQFTLQADGTTETTFPFLAKRTVYKRSRIRGKKEKPVTTQPRCSSLQISLDETEKLGPENEIKLRHL